MFCSAQGVARRGGATRQVCREGMAGEKQRGVCQGESVDGGKGKQRKGDSMGELLGLTCG